MDQRIDETEAVAGGTYMVHLNLGFCLNDEGCHTFGADDKHEIQKTMRRVVPCQCTECV